MQTLRIKSFNEIVSSCEYFGTEILANITYETWVEKVEPYKYELIWLENHISPIPSTIKRICIQ